MTGLISSRVVRGRAAEAKERLRVKRAKIAVSMNAMVMRKKMVERRRALVDKLVSSMLGETREEGPVASKKNVAISSLLLLPLAGIVFFQAERSSLQLLAHFVPFCIELQSCP